MRFRVVSTIVGSLALILAVGGISLADDGEVSAAQGATVREDELPRLEQNGGVTQLIVDGEPYMIRGGELNNSSSSSREYMAPRWGRMAKTESLNTVLAAVNWAQFEPEQGKYDYDVVDDLIKDARKHDKRLILLWFGSFKNGQSSYAPTWVKKDEKTYPRAEISAGTPENLSVFSKANVESDAKAFAEMMARVRDVDNDHTVITVQVENEVGLHGDTRDRSAAADKAFAADVPQDLMKYITENERNLRPELLKAWRAAGSRTSGNWAEVFGKGALADEFFMAWHYGRYLNSVAAAGKEEFDIPMFVNAWIVQPEDKSPGDYPSGGPVSHVHDVWRAAAPSIDMLTPDIYLPNFASILDDYSAHPHPIFVPESPYGQQGAAQAFYAVGSGAIGYSPFGIDNDDALEGEFVNAYDVLDQMAPTILRAQADGAVRPILLTPEKPTAEVKLGGYRMIAERATGGDRYGYAVAVANGQDEFLVGGNNVEISFEVAGGGPPTVGVAWAEEGAYRDGKWVPGRVLSGDETNLSYDIDELTKKHRSGMGLEFGTENEPSIQRVELYRFG